MYRVSGDRDWSAVQPSTSVLPEVAASYPGGPSVVRPGTATETATTFTNDGKVPVTDVRTTLEVPDGWTATAASPTTTHNVGSGRTFTVRWQVTAPDGTAAGSYPLTATTRYLWDDGTRSASAAGSTTVVVVTPLPAGTSQLGDDDWTSASNGWGPVERNTSNGEQAAGDGRTMTVQGATFQHGLGVHAASEVDYYAGGGCSTLSATVGLDDEAGEHGNQVVFQVWADGTKVAEQTVSATDAAVPVTADVSDADFLRLVVTEGSDGKNYDHADWADATVTC
jgi:alpha-galactosidase